MVYTRLNISHIANVVSRFMKFFRKDHRRAMKWILRYLRSTTYISLVYDKVVLLKVMLRVLYIQILLVI